MNCEWEIENRNGKKRMGTGNERVMGMEAENGNGE